MNAEQAERFVSEAIEPVADTFDTSRMATGEPGLPGRSSGAGDPPDRGRPAHLARDGSVPHGSPESYVRKHWFEVTTRAGATLKVYSTGSRAGARCGALVAVQCPGAGRG